MPPMLDSPPAGGVSWNSPDPGRTRVPPTPDPETTAADEPDGPEARLIRRAQQGDRQASADLVAQYWDPVHRWLFHLTRDPHRADDLTQETFLKALAGLKSFRPGSNFRAWIFRIGHNNFVNLKRQEKRTAGTLPEELPGQDIAAQTTASDREALDTVTRAVDDLPPEFRAALLLHAQEGLQYREIAKILRTTEETARWRVFKARQKLMKVLAPELIPEK
jgi:RNA polymerase sigma-70 factor, ECF subfamily